MAFTMRALSAILLLSLLAACDAERPAGGHLQLTGGAVRAAAAGGIDIVAGLDLQLSDTASEAVQQGLELTLAAEARVGRRHPGWAWQVYARRFEWKIAYLPLSRRYRLLTPDGRTATYARWRHLTTALAEPLPLTLDWHPETGDPAVYQVQFKAWLDRQKLPSPLRLPALFSRDWQHASGWSTWVWQGGSG